MPPRREPPDGLDVVLQYDGWVAIIRVRGELDLSTVDALRRVVDDAAASGHDLLFDLSACSFIDSTGISELLRAHRLAGDRDAGLVIVRAPDGEPARLLELICPGHFETFDDADDAVRALRPPTGTPSASE